MNRAYSILDIKAVDEADRVIRGIATTPTPDRIGDIIDPLGAKFALPLPMLWQHYHDEPIGHVELATPTKEGIPFTARIERASLSAALMQRLDEAWESIKLKLVRAVSIGFSPLKWSFLENGGIEYQEWEWLELSAVTIPANSEALITSVKSIDTALRRAAGVVDSEFPPPPEPAAIGKQARIVRLNDPPASRQPFIIREIRRT